MSVPGLADAAAITLKRDQYRCYNTITQNISASRYQGRCFFITGPGGTGKSYLLRALQYWCKYSREPCVLLAPTGIAARNIDGNNIHSALSIYNERGAYYIGLFQFNDDKKETLKNKKVLIIDEVSMVDTALFDYIFSHFAKLRDDPRPCGGMYIIVFGDLMQLPPVQGQKVFKVSVRHLFHPIFLRDPQRQRDRKFFNILNKIRFGIVDYQVKDALTERWQAYDPREEL